MARPTKEVLLQTKVTLEQETTIKTAAAAQGLSVAAYLRIVAMQSATAPLVNAWVANYGEPPEVWLARAHRAHYVLGQVRVGLSGEKTFHLFQLNEMDALVAVPPAAVAYGMDWLKRPDRHQLVLEGSHDRWIIVSTTHNASLGLVEIVLRPEGSQPTDIIRMRIRDARDGELVYTLQGGGQLRGRVDISVLGKTSCELRMTGGGTVTLPYANVVAVGSP